MKLRLDLRAAARLAPAFLLAAVACQSRSAPTAAVDAGPASAAPAAPPGASAAAMPAAVLPAAHPRVDRPPCRVLKVEGSVNSDQPGAPPVRPDVQVYPEEWLALAPKASLVVKEPVTARETTFRGPARVRACTGEGEETWVASGTFESSLGSGEAPGSEEWVVTPLGVFRFGTARMTVQVADKGVQMALAQGVAFLWTASDVAGHDGDGGLPRTGGEEGWTRLTGGDVALALSSPRTPTESAASALNGCRALARAARRLAGVLLHREVDGGEEPGAPPVPGPGAGTAAQQVTTRRLARAACGVASLRIATLPPSDLQGKLSAALRDTQPLWQELPPGPYGPR